MNVNWIAQQMVDAGSETKKISQQRAIAMFSAVAGAHELEPLSPPIQSGDVVVSKKQFSVRRATVDDAEAIGRIHKASWLTTYQGLIHQAFLDSIDVQKRTEAARLRALDNSLDCLVLVENVGNAIVGFADVGRSRDRGIDADGELYAIYLLQEKQGKGGGRLLFESALRAARERGFTKMMASALEDNEPSRKFYESMGGQFVDGHTRVIDSRPYPSIRYVWPLD